MIADIITLFTEHPTTMGVLTGTLAFIIAVIARLIIGAIRER